MKKTEHSSELTDVTKMTIRRVPEYTIQSYQDLKTRTKKTANEKKILVINVYVPQSGRLIANSDELDDLYGSLNEPLEQFAKSNQCVYLWRFQRQS